MLNHDNNFAISFSILITCLLGIVGSYMLVTNLSLVVKLTSSFVLHLHKCLGYLFECFGHLIIRLIRVDSTHFQFF